MGQEKNKDIVIIDGTYLCPECNSKRIILHQQCVIQKAENINTGKIINPRTNKSYMSNREKRMNMTWHQQMELGAGIMNVKNVDGQAVFVLNNQKWDE